MPPKLAFQFIDLISLSEVLPTALIKQQVPPEPKYPPQQIHTTVYKIGKQQGPTVEHRELYSISCNNL